MKKIFPVEMNYQWIRIVAPIILLTTVFGKNLAIGNGFYGDPFHHGEFVASLPSVLADHADYFTIHGAMDWVPAWLAAYFFGVESHFLPTMLMKGFLDSMAAFFLYFLVDSQVRKLSDEWSVLLLASSVVAVYFVGYRDIFLVLSVWIYFLCEQSFFSRKRMILEAIFGVALAVNLFWSFDRGIAGIFGVGFPCFLLLVGERRYFISLMVFVVSLWAMVLAGVLSFGVYIENFRFLLDTASQWSYGFARRPVLLTIMAAIPNGYAIYFLWHELRSAVRVSWKETAQLLLLIILSVLMFRIGTNRADSGHVAMALWMPAIVFLYLFGRCPEKVPKSASITILVCVILLSFKLRNYWIIFFVSAIFSVAVMRTRFPEFIARIKILQYPVAALAIILLCVNLLKISYQFSQDGFLWATQFLSPPTNRSLVDEGVLWVSSELLAANAACVFDLSNHGVINGVTGLPACTKYIYPVYATRPYEADLLQQVQQQSPPVVVFSSASWSFNIDGKSMHQRFPELRNYLLETYPHEKCNFGYCLRYINRP